MTDFGDSSPNLVYVLGSGDARRYVTYVGWTNDLARRVAQHNSGKGARATRGRNWVVLHVERFATREEAMSREWHLKRDRAFRRGLVQQHRTASLTELAADLGSRAPLDYA